MKLRVAAIALLSLALHGLAEAQQQQQPLNNLQRGWMGSRFESCSALSSADYVDVGSIAVLDSDVAGNIFPDPTWYKLTCANALHDHQCDKQIVAALGALYEQFMRRALGLGLSSSSVRKAVTKDRSVAEAAVGGALVGGAVGFLAGSPIKGAIAGATIGGLGQQFAVPLYKCFEARKNVNAISQKLRSNGSLSLTSASFATLIQSNLNQGSITADEAALLTEGASIMAGRAEYVAQTFR